MCHFVKPGGHKILWIKIQVRVTKLDTDHFKTPLRNGISGKYKEEDNAVIDKEMDKPPHTI